ncbi:VWA domain-containing protein, partial [Shewanella marina]|uniref:VWA domain-containing protein n=1 Tax=Shewanella marina TaxID=487319 RepID=UPI00046F3244
MTFHFIRPEWLFSLLPLVALAILLWRTKPSSAGWSRFIAPHLAKLLVENTNPQRNYNLGLLFVCWLIATIALAGPSFSKKELPVFASSQGRVIVMDMSTSLFANDMPPNRLTQEKFAATDLINSLKDGETGLIAYAGDAFIISPLTQDKATLLNLLPTLSPSIMPVQGSDVSSAIAKAKELLGQSGHVKGDIILLTDGVSAKQLGLVNKQLQGSQYRLAVMALGSEQGSPIQLPDGQLLKDNSNQVVIAKTDYSLLQQLASANNGIMLPVSAANNQVSRVDSWLSDSTSSKATDLKGSTWQDAGAYLVLLLLIPALLSFRYGLVSVLALCVLLPIDNAHASVWNDLWQTQAQQAQQAFDNKDYKQAADQFKDPQWQASALYKAGDYAKALPLFEQDNSATGLYNQANALIHMGKIDESIKQYQAALTLEPNMQAAKDNLAIAEKLKQQQDNKDKQNKSDKDKQQKPSQQDKKQGQSGQEQQQGQSGQDQQQGQSGQ